MLFHVRKPQRQFVLVRKFSESLDYNRLILVMHQSAHRQHRCLVDRHTAFTAELIPICHNVSEASAIKPHTTYLEHISAVRGFHITVILTVDSYYGVAESRCETFNSVACKKQFPGRNWRIWQSVGRIYHLRALSSIFPRRQPSEKPNCGGVAMHKAKMPRRQQLFSCL